jgi:hypothetical protein
MFHFAMSIPAALTLAFRRHALHSHKNDDYNR